LSAFTNDTEFITNSTDSLANYTKTSDLTNYLADKVDKKEGYSLISDKELQRLSYVTSYDDYHIMNLIAYLAKIKQDKNYTYSKTEIDEFLDSKANSKDVTTLLKKKVDVIEGKALSTNDYSTEEKVKLQSIEEGAQVNTVTSVNGQMGDVIILTSSDGSSSTGGSSYPAFCVNKGSVDDNGEPDFIEQTSTQITAKAPFVYTTAAGLTYEVSSDIVLDLSSYAYGHYNLFVNKATSGFELILLDNDVYIQAGKPLNPQENDIWFNTSVYPEYAYKYKNSKWLFCEWVHIAYVVINDDTADTDITTEEEAPAL